MFIKNAWYVACRPEEIQDKPLGRTICGEKIVFIVVKKTRLQPLKILSASWCPTLTWLCRRWQPCLWLSWLSHGL